MPIRPFIACALVLLCATAQGATLWTGTNFRIDASAPIDVGINLQAVTLTAVGLNGALPNAFDGITGGATGITTTGNLLAQVFEFGAPAGSPTPTLALILPANSVNYPIDSHFLVQPPGIISTIAPAENMAVADSTEATFAGFGNSLTGQFALSDPPAATWDFAYLVVKPGSVVDLNFRIADGSGQFTNELVQESLLVPEPSSLALATCALVGALAWARRRRS
jgi:hypothetical protein